MRYPVNARVPLLLGVLSLLGQSCVFQDSYETCGFSTGHAQQCIVQSDDSNEVKKAKEAANCVVDQPLCPDGFCVSYGGSAGFCSMECESDKDCPDGGACMEFAFGCTADEEGNVTCRTLCVKKSLAKK